MRLILIISAVLVLYSCSRNPAEKNEYDTIVDNEIERRYEMFEAVKNDTMVASKYKTVSELRNEIRNLILLTKDVENADPVILKVNDFFKKAAADYEIPYEGFTVVLKTMSLQTIETTIKTNELNLLDKILFEVSMQGGDSALMNSVY